MRRQSAPRSAWANVLIAALAAVGFAVTYAVGVQTRLGQRAEQTILDASRFAYEQPLLNLVSIPNLLIACVVIVIIAAVRRQVGAAIAGIAVIAASTLLAQFLKHGLLERPALITAGDNTFPSGHMTAFTAVTFALLLVMPPRIRPLVAIVGAIILSVAGVFLLDLGWHRPSDVLGSLLLVTSVSALAQLGVSDERSAQHPRGSVRAFIAVAVLIGAFAVANLALALLPNWPDAWVTPPMLAAQLGIVVAVLVSVAVVLWLSRRARRTATKK